ncbi:MAG TPA: hypothetical protein VLT62_08410 [Candidatus Methylomirabilis sp.]|nr:hypothetical protein [Candidatus Methylomirabilis sp.]
MTFVRVTFVSRRGWLEVVLVSIAFLSALAIVSALPGRLFGTVLSPAEAEESILSHLVAQATLQFHRRLGEVTPGERGRLQAGYLAEVESLKAREFVSVDVDTVIFGFFKIRRSFVVKAVTRAQDQQPSTHYYCFMGKYLTGECTRWHWLFAW